MEPPCKTKTKTNKKKLLSEEKNTCWDQTSRKYVKIKTAAEYGSLNLRAGGMSQ